MGSEIPEAPQSVLSNEETAVVFSWARISVSGRNRGTSPVSYFLLAPFQAAQKLREVGDIEKRAALDGLPLRRRMALIVKTSRLMDARVHGAVLVDPLGERHDDSLWSAHVGHTPRTLVLADSPYKPVAVHD
jgi:hypothetical protein